MATSFSAARNYVRSTLAAAFGVEDDALTVADDGSAFPAGRQIVRLNNGADNELVLVESRIGSTLAAAQRGYGGTAARSWNPGDAVELVMTANHLDELQTAVNRLETLPLHSWGMTTGIYTVPFRTNSFSSTFLQQNKLYLVPILIAEEVDTSTILCKLTSAGSPGSLVRLGLWHPAGGMKFTLVADAGTAPADIVGDAVLPLTERLPPALYAGSILHNSPTDIQFRSASFSGAGYFHLFPQTAIDNLSHLINKNFAFGGLPGTMQPPYSILGGIHIPLVGIGVV